MADRTLTIDVVTPDRVLVSEEITALVAPGVLGSFGVLSHHAPMLAELAELFLEPATLTPEALVSRPAASG